MRKAMLSMAQCAAHWLPNWLKQSMYRLGPISKLIRNALNDALPSGIHPVDISGGILRGKRMHLDLQSEKDFWLGTYEISLIDNLRKITKRGNVAYDLGANIGYISLVMAELLGKEGKVFAFEALPENVERLRDNITVNELQELIFVIPKAAAESSSKSTFLVHQSGGMGKLAISKGRDESYQREIKISTISLDDFVYKQGNPAPQIIKIDIEGGEGAALAGMRRILENEKPKLLIELHGPEASSSSWSELIDSNYQISSLDDPHTLIQSVKELDWKSYILAEAKE